MTRRHFIHRKNHVASETAVLCMPKGHLHTACCRCPNYSSWELATTSKLKMPMSVSDRKTSRATSVSSSSDQWRKVILMSVGHSKLSIHVSSSLFLCAAHISRNLGLLVMGDVYLSCTQLCVTTKTPVVKIIIYDNFDCLLIKYLD